MIKGIQIWAPAKCRSVLSLYESLAKEFGVPLHVICEDMGDERLSLGWDPHEYDHLDIEVAGRTLNERIRQLEKRKDFAQWIASYQNNRFAKDIVVRASELGCAIGVGSEAPNNGIRPSLKRLLKSSSLHYFSIRRRVAPVVAASSFIVNYSGDAYGELMKIGWPKEKIIPFGYYPKPLSGSVFKTRNESHWQNFTILVTGAMDWRRGQDVVIEAVSILKKWGCQPKVIMTQTGELYDGIKKCVETEKLNVELPGFVEYADLLRYYSECSLFIASGRFEPWGMRINDALNAGAPLLISRGMGGVKIINEYGGGCSYDAESPVDLAFQIKRMIDSKEHYLLLAQQVEFAARACAPEERARWLASVIQSRCEAWS